MLIHIRDIDCGMIIKAVSARRNRYRKVYKVVVYNYDSDPIFSIWSIPVKFNKKTSDWEEECEMVSNSPDRISHLCQLTDNGWVETKIKIDTTLVNSYVS